MLSLRVEQLPARGCFKANLTDSCFLHRLVVFWQTVSSKIWEASNLLASRPFHLPISTLNVPFVRQVFSNVLSSYPSESDFWLAQRIQTPLPAIVHGSLESTGMCSWAFFTPSLLNSHLLLFFVNEKQSTFLALQASIFWILSIPFHFYWQNIQFYFCLFVCSKKRE